MIESLILVVLLIALAWLILYCFYIKCRLNDWEQYVSRINAEQVETRRLLKSLGKKLWYELPPNLDWEKADAKKQ